jgi:hypothetical protein
MSFTNVFNLAMELGFHTDGGRVFQEQKRTDHAICKSMHFDAEGYHAGQSTSTIVA